ncbi:Protocatechuate 4,5-dioxygenase beta chain [Castellaniella defragrans 65Phen]|uniref:Protocatechuate 4,5-dioxygenase beta chain n=2 Tax=Castellaniella defragrans TaxID=75697 RepID=W8X2Q5_CASD6|nr:gallate dioxygenase [Castellaniella defragrans]KAB0615946.1 gallate dioxygenase [Castellaniella defragrans]MBB6085424.1 gallate dioxygenase [Castellaniella defragrans]CDM23687.1 Protocatechuate 4,5-dioxygenase beta chain [Castellaniella defragrans 65Phen]
MARIVGGIGASHSPTIGYAKDTGKQDSPAWKPIFEGFDRIRGWIKDKEIDVLFMIYNDHVTSFFFDHYSAFALGIDDLYVAADEGGGPREVAPARGHLGLSQHIALSLMADEFDMSIFQGKPVDHGVLSPLSMLGDERGPWTGQVVPLQVGVLQFPIPSAKRMWKLGKTLRKAIESYPEDLNVAIMATGGLSHQVHGERAGFIDEAWDNEFLDLLEKTPENLVRMRIAEFAAKGGMEGAEVVMWLIMRGALSDQVRLVHRQTYAPSVTNIATLILEDLGGAPDPAAVEAYRTHIVHELEGAGEIPGSYPFTHARSQANLRINSFLHDLVKPAHRARFVTDFEALANEHGLTVEEKDLIRNRKWIEMVRRGVSFFVLEKMAAVLGVSNPEVYAAFRGESLEQFLATRKVPMTYSVAGGDKVREMDKA